MLFVKLICVLCVILYTVQSFKFQTTRSFQSKLRMTTTANELSVYDQIKTKVMMPI